MSDLATAEPAGGVPPESKPASQGLGSGSAPKGTPPEVKTDWRSGLDEDIRSANTIKELKADSPAEALRSISKMLVNQEKLLGREKWPVLKEDATLDEKRDWYTKYMGMPKEPTEYPMGEKVVVGKKDDGTPIETDVPMEKLEKFRNLAHEANLTSEQATKVFESLMADEYTSQTTGDQELQARIAERMATLHEEKGYDFKPMLDMANEAYMRLVSEELQEIMPQEVTNHPDFIKMFAELASQIQDDSARGLVVSGKDIHSSTQALQAIQDLESSEDYANVMNGSASIDVKQRVLETRQALYTKAYPSEND